MQRIMQGAEQNSCISRGKIYIPQTLEQLNLSKKSPKACCCTLCFPFRIYLKLQFQFTRSTATALNYFEHCWKKKEQSFIHTFQENISILQTLEQFDLKENLEEHLSISLREISYFNDINLNSCSVLRAPHSHVAKNPWSGVPREFERVPTEFLSARHP